MSMRLFGNTHRRKRKASAEPAVQESPTAQEPSREAPADNHGLNGKTRGMLYLAVAFALFVGSVILCLLLIDKSSEIKTILVPEMTTQGAQETQPTATLPPTDAPMNVELEVPTSVNQTAIYSILLAVTDEDDITDTMVLFSVDANQGTLSLLSIPRDTYISGNYALPKMNRVYAEAGGGERGVMALKEKFRENFGFDVDYYITMDYAALSKAVELCGGVSVALPSELSYLPDDADLSAGIQTLSGAQAVDLFRFDESYSDVEPEVYAQPQQTFLRALLAASFGSKTAEELNEDLTQMMSAWDTDLTVGNLLYFAEILKNCSFTDISFKTFSGDEITVGDVDFFEIDPESALILLNTCFNPTGKDLTGYHLNIRQKTGSSSDGEVTWTGFGNSNNNNNSNNNDDDDDDDDPTEDDPTDDEPSDGEPTEDEPTDGEPTEDEPSDAEPSEDEPSESDPTDSDSTEPQEPEPSEPQESDTPAPEPSDAQTDTPPDSEPEE